MFEKRESPKDAETIIGPSVMIKGNFNCKGNVIVEGVLKGHIKTYGDIFIGNKAKMSADIEAKTARVGGEIRGNIKAETHLQVVSSARIFGDIECSSLSVEEGAIINGKCTMSKGTKDIKSETLEEDEEKKEEKEKAPNKKNSGK